MSRYQQNNRRQDVEKHAVAKQRSERTGLLFASGLITGEALIGIGLAIPIVITESDDFMAVTEETLGSLPGLIVILAICGFLYRIAAGAYKAE